MLLKFTILLIITIVTAQCDFDHLDMQQLINGHLSDYKVTNNNKTVRIENVSGNLVWSFLPLKTGLKTM